MTFESSILARAQADLDRRWRRPGRLPWWRRYLRRWAYRATLIRYCVHCDGSINEAEARGRPFMPERWVGHYPHERYEPQGPLRT